MNRIALFALVSVFIFGATALRAQSIPKPLKTRLIVGDPVWREMPIRPDLQKHYDKVWQTALNTILEHNYDVATMDKESGYLRTTWNESIIMLKDNWFYKVQVSIKLVTSSTDSGTLEKIRIQVTGDVTNSSANGGLKAYFRGYDQVILQNLLQDLQAKLGAL